MTWLAENEFVATSVTELVSHLGTKASGLIGLVAVFVEGHAQAIIGLAGLAFGFVKWWRYREQILHQRLAEYLRESDARLKQGQVYVLEALQRPGPGQPFKLPLFASNALRSVLRENNWDRATVAMNVEASADLQLADALDVIKRQLATAEANITSLRQQFATAHILRGAIASSTALRKPSKAPERNNFALTEFRTALQTPGHQNDVAAKELEAHQLRKLKYLDQALTAYKELETISSSVEDQRSQTLLKARAKRYQAEIIQACASQVNANNKLEFLGTRVAHALVSYTINGSALNIRQGFAPYQRWDLLEEGDINYVAAFISHNLNFCDVETAHLDNAQTAYESIIGDPSARRLFSFDKERRLRLDAKSGLSRVRLARNGDYDANWLTLP